MPAATPRTTGTPKRIVKLVYVECGTQPKIGMCRKAVDECEPSDQRNRIENIGQKVDVTSATCYKRLCFCTPRCHQIWAVVGPQIRSCSERLCRESYVFVDSGSEFVLTGATKIWAVVGPQPTCVRSAKVDTAKD